MNDRPSGWHLAAFATGMSAFVSLGFSVASLINPVLIVSGLTPGSVAPLVAYAAARSTVIAIATVVVLVRGSAGPLVTVGWIAGGVQALDVIPGIMQHDIFKTAGPAALAAFSAYGLVRLSRLQHD